MVEDNILKKMLKDKITYSSHELSSTCKVVLHCHFVAKYVKVVYDIDNLAINLSSIFYLTTLDNLAIKPRIKIVMLSKEDFQKWLTFKVAVFIEL